jgi:hypothetical protein
MTTPPQDTETRVALRNLITITRNAGGVNELVPASVFFELFFRLRPTLRIYQICRL